MDTFVRCCPGTKLGDHEFNKLILDLANSNIKIKDEDQANMLLTSLSASYGNFVESLLYGRESLTMEDVLATLNSRGSKKRTKGEKEEYGYMKGKHDQDFDSSSDEGRSYHMRHRRDFLYDFTRFDGGLVQLEDVKYVPALRSVISLVLLKNRVILLRCRCVESSMEIQNKLDSSNLVLNKLRSNKLVKKIRLKQLGPSVETKFHGVHVDKRVWFEVELHGAQGNREAEGFQVSNDDTVAAQSRLEDRQIEEKTNTGCLVKEQENVHLGIKMGVNVMVTGVPGQESAEGNVTEKKKVKKYIEANLGKLLMCNAWSTRWSPVQGSNMRKGC
ncbi:hypothetical protein Tco_0223446 [Tanacetum coccineum]